MNKRVFLLKIYKLSIFRLLSGSFLLKYFISDKIDILTDKPVGGLSVTYIFTFSEKFTYGQMVSIRRAFSEEKQMSSLMEKYIAQKKMTRVVESSFDIKGYGHLTLRFKEKADFYSFDLECSKIEKNLYKKTLQPFDWKVDYKIHA